MRGRKNPTPNQTPPNLPPCKVCGEQGTGFHYGVTACGACKGFFRRSLVRKESYVCTGTGSCVIGPETKRRKSCPKCRHDKCLAVGMSKEAIKTGRYSYVKKSHDIIEMIEHHFQHYSHGKQFDDGNLHDDDDNLQEDFEVPRKKLRSSCALEKISEAFRQPSSEFMELSPSKPTQRSQNVFRYENSNHGNDVSARMNQMNDAIISDVLRTSISKDISLSNDSVCSSTHQQNTFADANDSFPSICSDLRHSEFSYYFDSPSSQPPQSTSTPSPLSLASPMSDISKGSPTSISPPWLDLPNYSGSSYSDMSPDDRSSYLSYRDKEFEDLEPYYKQHISLENDEFECRETHFAALTANEFEYVKQNSYSNEINFPIQQYTLQQQNVCDISTNGSDYHSYSKQNTLSYNNEQPKLHTPVSNELEQLRRLSWDDMNFNGDLVSPCYNFLTDDLKSPEKTASALKDFDKISFNVNSHNITNNEISKDFISPELGSSSYWDLDNTQLPMNDLNSKVSVSHNSDQFYFPETTKADHSCIHSDPFYVHASYYRDRQGSDSSDAISAVIESQNVTPNTDTSKIAQLDNDTISLDINKFGITETAEEKHYLVTSDKLSKSLEVTDIISLSPSAVLPSSLNKDCKEGCIIKPAVTSDTFTTSTLENSEEPLNFLNIPLRDATAISVAAEYPHETEPVIPTCWSSVHRDEYSPKSEEIFSNITIAKSEVYDDHELLEKWTPFSLSEESPRIIEHEKEFEKSSRLQDNEDDYKNKPLPWCEFTEAELDDVVMSLKTSYQRHVVLDTNLLSDQEIAEKLKSFLDILQLREQTFGKCDPIDSEAYFKILEATGIDLGGRREWVETNAKIFNRSVQKTVRFFRSVPGFKDICHEDKIVLAKSCMYEYIVLSCYRGVNFEKQVILDAEHKLAFNMDFVRIIAPEMEEHVLDMFELSRKLMDLKLSFEETLILKVISIISPDRDKLKEFEKVDRMYWRLHCCLLLSLWRRKSSPMQFYARVISAITHLRELAFNGRQLMCKLRPEMLKLTKDIQVPLYLELMFTQADVITDVEFK